MRRIVTGHDSEGRSVIVERGEVAEFEAGPGATIIGPWRSDVPARYPNDGADPPPSGFAFPPVGGCTVAIIRLRAGGTEAFDAFIVEALTAVADPTAPGMHKTATTDFDLVLEGELTLEVDDGVEEVLYPGDIVVQNGTRHRWINRGATDAVWAAFVVGAEHADAPTF